MTDDDVLALAADEGFELEERPLRDKWVWGWCRGTDTRWPCYFERRQALNWMRDRMRRGRVSVLTRSFIRTWIRMGIRTWSIGVVCVASAAFSLTLAGATGSAQQAEPAGSTITIGKVVLGTAPAGTVFVVTYTCEVPDDPASNFSGTLQFNTDDFPMPLYSFTAFYGTHCIVTETDNGGATSVKYTCTENPRGNTCRGAANDFFVGPFDGEAVIGVTNQMTPPPTTNPTATPAVVLQPAFTG